MAHMMGERGDSGRSRSRRAAFSQTAGQEIWRPCSDDRDLLPDPTQIQALSRYLAPPSLSEFSVFVSTGQADRRKRAWQSGSQQSSDDDEHPLTSSKCSGMDSGHSRSRSGSDSFDWSCPPLPGQVPVEPTGTSNGRNVQGAMEASPHNKISTGQADRTLQSGSQQSSDEDEHPFSSSSSSSSSKCSCIGHFGSRRTASTDSSLGIMSSLSLSSRGSLNVIWRWSGDGSDSQSEQVRSDSIDWSCPPLPGQVPVEPTGTSNGRNVQGAMEASPLNKISTGQADRTLQSGSQQSSDEDEHPFSSSSSSSKCSCIGHFGSRRTVSRDSSLGIMSSLSLSSRGSLNVIWRWSGDGLDSQSEQGRSESFDWSCPPLPGQVPVEPTGTSNGRNVQGAMEASPYNKISTVQIGT
ncbi:probable GH family 25 lysozyme 3 [Pseudorasbora parva]|uniref:probable GH family 25 lysozyme 3 n=1 Tax=Pseudorasbora parva TaxID=51549 RepID=UPI00351EEDBC